MNLSEHWSTIFKALSEPIRLRLMALLAAKREMCVCDLVQGVERPQSAVSRHLAYLLHSGLVEKRREGKWIYYSLAALEGTMEQAIIKAMVEDGGTDEELKADLQRLESGSSTC